jgi:hypothetical protein
VDCQQYIECGGSDTTQCDSIWIKESDTKSKVNVVGDEQPEIRIVWLWGDDELHKPEDHVPGTVAGHTTKTKKKRDRGRQRDGQRETPDGQRERTVEWSITPRHEHRQTWNCIKKCQYYTSMKVRWYLQERTSRRSRTVCTLSLLPIGWFVLKPRPEW